MNHRESHLTKILKHIISYVAMMQFINTLLRDEPRKLKKKNYFLFAHYLEQL